MKRERNAQKLRRRPFKGKKDNEKRSSHRLQRKEKDGERGSDCCLFLEEEKGKGEKRRSISHSSDLRPKGKEGGEGEREEHLPSPTDKGGGGGRREKGRRAGGRTKARFHFHLQVGEKGGEKEQEDRSTFSNSSTERRGKKKKKQRRGNRKEMMLRWCNPMDKEKKGEGE